jgi:SAM-dependent methyltransferase
VHQDAIDALAQLPNDSIAIVSGFHIAEHLEFERLGQLIAQAHRVLCPGGLLILETPNPENIAVATNYFYIDPTHVRPLPPDLMAFLPKYYDFFRSKIVRLQEDHALHERPITQIAQIIHGVSPDYAVIAQKQGLPDLLACWDGVFEADFGITLGTLSARYYQAQQADKHHFEEQLKALAVQAELWNRRYMEVIESQSWRITAPIRSLKAAYLEGRQAANNFYRLRLLGAIKAILGNSLVRQNIGRLMRRFPTLQRPLLAVASKVGLIPASRSAPLSSTPQDLLIPEQIEAAQLSEYEQSILIRMIQAMRQKG